MAKNKFYPLIAALLFIQAGCSQNTESIRTCYLDNFPDNEKVLTKMTNKPHFLGGNKSFNDFLSENINFETFTSGLFQNSKIYTDTARLKFVVNKQGGLSNLSVTLAKKKMFAEEIARVIKKSSCSWVAGSTGELANGWIQYDLYYKVEKSNKEVTTTMTLNEYVFSE